MNIDGWRKAKMLQNDQPVTERNENRNREDCCSCAQVSLQEKRQVYETRKVVANSLDPHKRKGGRNVDWDADGGAQLRALVDRT